MRLLRETYPERSSEEVGCFSIHNLDSILSFCTVFQHQSEVLDNLVFLCIVATSLRLEFSLSHYSRLREWDAAWGI